MLPVCVFFFLTNVIIIFIFTGSVYEFDVNGKEKSNGQTWSQCLPIRVLEDMTYHHKISWDRILNEVFNQRQWAAEW